MLLSFQRPSRPFREGVAFSRGRAKQAWRPHRQAEPTGRIEQSSRPLGAPQTSSDQTDEVTLADLKHLAGESGELVVELPGREWIAVEANAALLDQSPGLTA